MYSQFMMHGQKNIKLTVKCLLVILIPYVYLFCHCRVLIF